MKLIQSDFLIKEIIDFFNEKGLSLYGCSICIALSGGPDSLSLLYIFNEIRFEYNLDLSVAYIQHTIRDVEISEKETKFIKDIADKLNVKLYSKICEKNFIINRAKLDKDSIENSARKIRYDFFDKVKRENSIDFFVTGHNKDENYETILMRLFQGSSVLSLSGIPDMRDYFIRPFLKVKKSDIIEFLKVNNLDFIVDKSNDDNSMYRNMIRNRVIPKIRESVEFFDDGLDSFIKKVNLLSDAIEIDYNKYIYEDSEKIYINILEIKELKKFYQIELIYFIFNKLEINERISYKFVENILNFNFNRLKLKNIDIFLDRDRLCFFKDVDIITDYVIDVSKEGCYKIGETILEVSIKDDIPNDSSLWFDLDKIEAPIFIRNYRKGDFIDNPKGVIRVSKVLKNWNLNKEIKKNVPILCDFSGIIGILGEAVNCKNKISYKQYTQKKCRCYILSVKGGDFER